jgi:hypothetical protein
MSAAPVCCVLMQLCSNTTPPTYPLLALGNEDDGQQKWQTIRGGFAAAFAADAVQQYVPILAEEVRQGLLSYGLASRLVVFCVCTTVLQILCNSTCLSCQGPQTGSKPTLRV